MLVVQERPTTMSVFKHRRAFPVRWMRSSMGIIRPSLRSRKILWLRVAMRERLGLTSYHLTSWMGSTSRAGRKVSTGLQQVLSGAHFDNIEGQVTKLLLRTPASEELECRWKFHAPPESSARKIVSTPPAGSVGPATIARMQMPLG